MNHKHSIAALGAAAALAGCVGGGPVTEDWTEESRAAARTGLATMLDGTVQVITGPDGYLDPARPPAQVSGLGARAFAAARRRERALCRPVCHIGDRHDPARSSASSPDPAVPSQPVPERHAHGPAPGPAAARARLARHAGPARPRSRPFFVRCSA